MKWLPLLIILFVLDVKSQTQHALNPTFQAQGDHGGRNGGSDLEIELRKRLLQIGQFINSPIGQEIFSTVNTQSLLAKVSRLEIDVTSSVLTDKYGVVRTCVNEVDKELITCDVERMLNLFSNGKDDIINVILLHEVLGLMSIEHGYQENVSIYPISSLILPFSDDILAMPIMTQEVVGNNRIINQSYGVTLINRSTNESIFLMCLDPQVKIYRCEKFSLVRKQGEQLSLVSPNVPSISYEALSQVKIPEITPEIIKKQQDKIRNIQSKGFQFLTIRDFSNDHYRFGLGAIKYFVDIEKGSTEDKISKFVLLGGALLATANPVFLTVAAAPITIDVTVEGGKQIVNTVIFPAKLLFNSMNLMHARKRLKLNTKLNLVNEILNTKSSFNLIGRSKTVSNEDYDFVVNVLRQVVKK